MSTPSASGMVCERADCKCDRHVHGWPDKEKRLARVPQWYGDRPCERVGTFCALPLRWHPGGQVCFFRETWTCATHGGDWPDEEKGCPKTGA